MVRAFAVALAVAAVITPPRLPNAFKEYCTKQALLITMVPQ